MDLSKARSVLTLLTTSIVMFVSPITAQDFITGYARSAWNLNSKEVVHVTNLNSNGPGSFRDAVSQPNRIVIFDVGGVINISSAINIDSDNIVIAAFTAPGPYGIITKGRRGIRIRGNNVALVGLKVWIDSFATGVDGIQASGNNILIAYGSTMFATDESLTTFGNASSTSIEASDITFFKMIAVGANNGHQAAGGMMNSKGVGNVDFIKCVAAFNQIRSFRFGSSVENETQFGNQYNCVIYNWLNAATELQGPAHVNIIGNFFKRGPSNGIKEGITSENSIMYIADNNNNKLSRLSSGFELLNEPIAVPYEYSFISADQAYEELITAKQVGWRNTSLENQVLEHIENGTDQPGGVDGVTNVEQLGGWPTVSNVSTTHIYSNLESYLLSFFDDLVTDVPETIDDYIRIYPNPASNQLIIDSSLSGTFQYQIMDVTGRKVKAASFNQREILDLSSLLTGLYVVRILDDGGPARIFKILKQ